MLTVLSAALSVLQGDRHRFQLEEDSSAFVGGGNSTKPGAGGGGGKRSFSTLGITRMKAESRENIAKMEAESRENIAKMEAESRGNVARMQLIGAITTSNMLPEERIEAFRVIGHHPTPALLEMPTHH
ncbi:hypothetical protein B0H67DRAFT_680978 [Lasiosphaeris hirsuta]|uniref:Uncharacterized protein n=1 Tax=Lasiosphaeris hirsuta TaxID=260670 RepID=A0AA40B142_9PEZI|nr:hypothetical protein B0H67DRAFT_680978 [Lasiosphaeris hirsuta]